MLSIISMIFLLLWIGAAIWDSNLLDVGEGIFFSALVIVVIAGILIGCSLAYTEIFGSAGYRVTERGHGKIVSLRDAVGSNGSFRGGFFLGIGGVTGSFGGALAYTWYEREPDGSLHGQLIEDDGFNEVRVIETNSKSPHVTFVDAEDPCHTPWWVNPIHELCDPAEYQRYWQIFVPKGTVTHGYLLNGASGA